VQAQAQRTERQLKGVISVLVVILGVGLMLYMVRNRQVRRLQEANTEAERGLRSVDAALEQLDDQTRQQVFAKLQEYQHIQERLEASQTTVPPATPRRDDYLRK
jgi:flagellar biosynthesis/type III secretory pathway M-ring protein FliF/YscJ